MSKTNTSRRIVRHFVTFACLACVLMQAADGQELTGRGRNPVPTIERQLFPADHPALRFDLPAGWTLDRGNDDKSMLVCNLKGRGDIGLVCVAVPQIFSHEDFVNILPGLAKEQLDRQNLTEIEIVSQGNDKANEWPYFFVITKGKLRGHNMSVTFIGLASEQGRGYLLEYALPSADGPAHMKDFQTIIKSLAPVK